jgi:hypothetical protein
MVVLVLAVIAIVTAAQWALAELVERPSANVTASAPAETPAGIPMRQSGA